MATTSSILPVYRRAELSMQRGEGVYLFDSSNRRYLDFAAGIAVNALGHCHPHLVNELQQQTATLWHCSNLFHNEPLEKFSQRLVKATGLDSVFCCNSGAEAAEAAIKFTRRYHDKKGLPQRYRIIVADGAFHGRTLAALSACRNPKAIDGYAPLVDCFDVVPFNKVSAIEAAITEETAAIMLEPVQGEGGIRPHSIEYLQTARQLCDRYGLLFVIDEVQCGMGRSGTLFASEQYGVQPDILLAGKGIGNGFPLAACIVNNAVASVMEPGSHGSTYGSNPLAMCVGNAVLDIMLADNFFEQVRQRAQFLNTQLQRIKERYYNSIADIRGMGLLIGIATKVSAYELAKKLRENGLIVAPAGDTVIRLLPPLIVTDSHSEEALHILERTLATWHHS